MRQLARLADASVFSVEGARPTHGPVPMTKHNLQMVAVAVAVLLLATSCAVTTQPKFTPDVQQSFADHEMRRMQTERLQVYYPEERAEEAEQIATRLEGCLAELEDDIPRPTDWGPVPVYLPEVEFNNAYVMFGAGFDPHIVVPTFFTSNIFGQFGFTPTATAVGCHEMVHYLHFIQIHGFYRAINEFMGPSINPQTGLDLWFFEGLATYYESQLVEGVGRYGSPIWENIFAAGIADDHLDGGRLSQFDRSVPNGAHYLVGSYFVAYLVDEYGEERLWRLVDRQGASIFFPFGVSYRFYRVYGASLGSLIDEFEAHVRREFEPRDRPEGQETEQWVGRDAIFEVGPHGETALYSQDVDSVAAIEVFDEHGDRLLRREIPDLLPGRDLLRTRTIEGLRFSPDGDDLYFLANHQGRDHGRTSLMRLDIEANDLEIVRDDLRAVGGDLTPEGDGYLMAKADGNRVRFIDLDLTQESETERFALPRGAYVGWIRLSPDGDRVATTLMQDDEWSVAVFDVDTGELLDSWTTGESHQPAFDPYWLDDERLLFVASGDERIQVVEGRLDDETVHRHTNVPYMAFNPRPDGDGGLRFLNRQDWGWSLDHLPQTVDLETDIVAHRNGAPDTDEPVRGYPEPEYPAEFFDDQPYSMLDGLFIPRLRSPRLLFETAGVDDINIIAGLGLTGHDELGFHHWLVDAQWNFGDEQLSGSAAYINTQLAPWYLTLEVINRWQTMNVPVDGDPTTRVFRDQRDRVARFQAQRPVYDIPVRLEAIATEYLREDDAEGDEESRTLVGAEVGARYQAERATSYGGAQWLFGLGGDVGGYPSQIGSDFSMGHLRSQLDIQTPLPLSDRHRLRLSGRGRFLPGAPDDEPVMRLGGFHNYAPIVSTGETTGPVTNQLLPTGFLFAEPLRGYEDMAMLTNQMAAADIDYRYPLIVDRGAASGLMLLPSVFLRQFDVELFGAAATRFDDQFHAAVGASIDMSIVFWRLPLRLRYQMAQRLVDDEQTVFTLSFGAGF